MKLVRLLVFFFGLIAAIGISAYLLAVSGNAQTADRILRPDIRRALKTQNRRGARARKDSSRPSKPVIEQGLRPRSAKTATSEKRIARPVRSDEVMANAPISAGTSLSRVLHSSQISMTSTAGTDEQYVDRTNDLVADDRTTFDSGGGSFDIAVGRSGARYEVFSATIPDPNDNTKNILIGVLVVALDTNGDYVANVSTTFDLERDFDLPSAAAVVSGNGSDGREFVIVSSSGYFNPDNPNDPFNEPSPGVVLLIRDPNTNGFDTTQSRTLVTVGDDRLFNANAMALMPNNDLLIADFFSNELRIIRDTNGDRIPDTLDNNPYYSYQFSDDAPIDVAVNSRGLVFSHSEGNDTLMLAIYDDNNDGRGDHDEVVVEGLSIDNNLFLHGMTIDRKGTVYVIEDASSSEDGAGGNGGTARIDAFADPHQDGFLENGKIFTVADANDFGLTGLGFGPVNNQLANTEVFVRQHYLDFLNREPDPSGFAFWVGNIESCGADNQCREVKRIDTSAAFFLSIEFQQTGYFVERAHKAAYGDATGNSTLVGAHTLPVPIVRLSEFLHDKQQIAEGVVVGPPGGPWEALLNNNKNLYVADFVQRSRFTTEFPASMSAGAFVDKLNTRATDPITHVLPLSTTERNQLVADLTNGTKTRAQVLRAVVEDTEFESAELSRAFVLTQYFGYLRRNPNDTPDADYTGYDFWLKKLNDFGGDFRAAEMVKAFILSGEYRERFE